ncbi:hypothetical protein ACI2TD_25080 [Ralstonia nicotianae]
MGETSLVILICVAPMRIFFCAIDLKITQFISCGFCEKGMKGGKKIEEIFGFQRLKSAMMFGAMFSGILGLICLVYFPAFFLIAASSPLIRWRVANCHYDGFWVLIVETIVPYFIIGAILGFIFKFRPKFNLGYAAKVFLCFVVAAGLIIATFEDVPSSDCGEQKELPH